VFLGRFVGVFRALVPFVAGASRMPYLTFLPCNALGALIWAPSFVYLGFLAGHPYRRVERLAGRAGLVLAIGVVLLLAVVLAARWVTRHPDRVLGPLRRLAARPTVLRLRHRYARQLAFLAARFNPATALGLAMTAQLVVLALLGAAFAGVTEDVLANEEIVRFDDPMSRFLVGQREAWLTSVMRVITNLGSGFVVVPLVLLVGLLARRAARSWRPLFLLALILAGATLTSTVIKLVVARPRPETRALVHALGDGFPSGHSTAAAAAWLSAAFVLGRLSRRTAVRVTFGTVAVVITALVGVSRVYLGVHQPTDVLGGWALGALWVAGVLITVQLLSHHPAPSAAESRPPRHAGAQT